MGAAWQQLPPACTSLPGTDRLSRPRGPCTAHLLHRLEGGLLLLQLRHAQPRLVQLLAQRRQRVGSLPTLALVGGCRRLALVLGAGCRLLQLRATLLQLQAACLQLLTAAGMGGQEDGERLL